VPKKRWSAWEWSALAGYCLLVGYATRHHQPWADEAQAWLIVRDCSLREVFMHRLHYEGTPGLWSLVLWLLMRLHVSYTGMRWFCAVAATAGVAVWLRWSPFPRWLRLLFPFTFFIAYQYAVLSRSYVLFPLLTFCACALLDKQIRKPRPLLFALVLALLANLCMYGAAMAAGLAVVYLRCAWKNSREKNAGETFAWKPHAAAALLFVCAWVFAVATASPAKDVGFNTGVLNLPQMQKLLHRHGPQSNSQASAQPAQRTTPTPEEMKLVPPKTGSWWRDRLWLESHAYYRGVVRPGRHVYRAQQVVFAMSLLIFPLAKQFWLGYLAVAGLVYRVARQRFPLAFLPYVLVFAACMVVYAAEHHTGLVLIAFLTAAWLSWPRQLPVQPLARAVEEVFRITLGIIFVLQIGWTIHAVRFETVGQYSGDAQAAKFLGANAEGKKVAGFYSLSSGVEAYFGHKIFFNQPASFWAYSLDPSLNMPLEQVVAARPEYVVLGTNFFRDQVVLNQFLPMLDTTDETPGDWQGIEDLFERNGYRETHRFCGLAPMRTGFSGELCQIVLEPLR